MTHRHIGFAAALVLALFTGACSDHGGGGTPLVCELPVVQCGVACVDVLTDEANCGACGRACAPGSTCTNGSCVAPPPPCGTGYQRCDAVCTSVATDEAHCGACGNACAAGELCVAGLCGPTCTAGAPTRCGAVCVNLQTEDANCGSCGRACAAGLHCRSGVCSDACALYETRCGGGVCAKPGLDDANCGACGVSCGVGEVCSGGACVATCSGTTGLPGLPLAITGAGTYGAQAMASGDLDGDGDLDFAFATVSSVIVLENLGGGRFAAPRAIALGSSVYDVVIADLTGDADGKLDIAATAYSYAAHDLVILLNDGSGGFAAPKRYDTAPGVSSAGPTGIAVADFDGDGRLDVAVANTYASNVAVFQNQGGGVFPAAPASYALDSSGYEWLAAGDLGGDGKPDLALAGSSTIRVLTNAGNGTFGNGASYPPWTAGFSVNPERIAIADVDGDGRKDVAFVERSVPSSYATVLWNAAAGPFTTRTQIDVGATTVYTMTLADLDADGRLDVVAPRYGDGMVAVARNLGSRTFGAVSAYPVGSNPMVSAVADLDTDGKLDVVAARGDHLALLQGNGDGTFVAPLRHGFGGTAVSNSRLADLNGDGHLDVVVVSFQDHTMGYALGNGDGTFGTLVTKAAAGYPADVAVGDLDGDGRPEIIVSKSGEAITGANRGIGVFVNDGTGAFADEVPYAMSSSPDELVLGDLNEDGKLDVVVNRSSLVDVRLGNGDGTLAAGYGLTLPYTISALAVADMDGDGKQDLVASVLDGATDWLLVFRNKGGATIGDRFGSSQAAKVQTATYGLDLAIADVDGDGRPDVLLAEQSHGVGVYRNLGSGQVAARVGYGATPVNYLAVSDLDGDRNLDVLAYGNSSGVFSLLRGQAGGTFAAPLFYATAGGAPMAGDLNGDARVDVATMGSAMGVHLTTCR